MIQSLLLKKISGLVIEKIMKKRVIKNINEFASNVKELDLKLKQMNARIKAIEDILAVPLTCKSFHFKSLEPKSCVILTLGIRAPATVISPIELVKWFIEDVIVVIVAPADVTPLALMSPDILNLPDLSIRAFVTLAPFLTLNKFESINPVCEPVTSPPL